MTSVIMPQASTTYIPPVQPPEPTRGRIVGLMANSEVDLGTVADLITGFTISLRWDSVQPTIDGPINLTKLNIWHEYAVDNDLDIRLRILGGIYAPQWVKTHRETFIPMQWYATNTTDYGTIGKFWQPDHRMEYHTFTDQLVSIIDDYPRVLEVTDSAMMTVTPEPMLRGWTVAQTSAGQPHVFPNRVAALNNGYDYHVDETGMTESFVIEYDKWRKHGVSVVFNANTYQRLYPDATIKYEFGKVTGPMMTTVAERGVHAVIGNNSIGNPIDIRGPHYERLWRYQSATTPATWQAMPINVMPLFSPTTNTYDTAYMCATELGGLSMELPSWNVETDSYYTIDEDQAETLNELFADNA